MKKLLSFFVILLSLLSSAQGPFTGEKEKLDIMTRISTMPDLDIWDKNGQKKKLRSYVQNSRLHEGKANMYIGFGTFGNYQIDAINDIASSKIPDNYNVIVLLLGDIKRMEASKLTDKEYEKPWSKLLIVKTTWEEMQNKLFLDSWPFSFFTDKDNNVIYANAEVIPVAKSTKVLLDNIQAGKLTKGGSIWYNEEGQIVDKSDAAAKFFSSISVANSRVIEEWGGKSKSSSKTSYIHKNGVYYYDGDVEAKGEKGQVVFTGTFKEGIPVSTVKAWYEDGSIRFNLPVNGLGKSFEADGKLSMEGEFVDGLGNGIFTYYEKGEKTGEYNFKRGEVSGSVRKYVNGELSEEFIKSAAYEEAGIMNDGLQPVKKNGLWGYIDRNENMVISPQYEKAYSFKSGVALVSKGGSSYYIDTKGKKLSAGEKLKTEINWKPDVKVYNTKAEIVKFLKEKMVPNLHSERYLKEQNFYFNVDSFDMYYTGASRHAFWSDITGVHQQGNKITLVGKFREYSPTDLWVETDITLKSDVSYRQVTQFRENIKKLALLSGAKMILENTPDRSLDETISYLNKAMKNAEGYSIGRSEKFKEAKLTASTLTVTTTEGSETYSGFDLGRIDFFNIDKEKNSGVYRVQIFFGHNSVTQETKKGSKWKSSAIDLYVTEKEVDEVINAIYLWSEKRER